MINGEKWFLMSSSFINGNQLMTGRQDGIYVYYPNFKESVLRYKYPVSLGEQYNSAYEEWTGYSDSLVTFQMTVDSTSELISTPSSRYQCNKYHAPAVFTTVRGSTTEIVSVDMYLSNIGPVEIVSGNVYTELLSTNVR
jgi:hypothetical protein